MKIKSSIKKRSDDCQIVSREGVRYVISKLNPKLKQRQGKSTSRGKKKKKK